MASKREKPFPWFGLSLAVFPFVEIGTTLLLTRLLGGWIVFFLFAIPALIGLFIQWRRFPTIKSMWAGIKDMLDRTGKDTPERKALSTNPAYWEPMYELQFYVVATILLLVPGLLSHILAFMFIIPPTRKRLLRNFIKGGIAYTQRQNGSTGPETTQPAPSPE